MHQAQATSPAPRARKGLPLLLLAFSILLSSCRPPPPAADPSDGAPEVAEVARQVEVVTARLGLVRDTITVSATLEARHTVDVPVLVPGTVETVALRPGDRVEAGAEILRVESRPLALAVQEQQLARDEAVQRAATAELDRENTRWSEEIAELAARKAESELARIEELLAEVGRKAVSDEAVEAARFARDEAQLGLQRARLATRRAAGDSTLATLAVERARVALDRASLDLERAVVLAPISGALTFLEIRPGEQVAAGTHVATVVDPRELFCTVRLPQRRLAAVRLGQEVEIEAETHPGRVFTGVLEAIVPVIDPAEGTIEARVRVDGGGDELRPGSFLSARIILSEREDALLVPKRARIFDGNLSYLYVVRDGRALRLPIEPGLLTDEELEVRHREDSDAAGGSPSPSLQPGDRVITRGQSRLRGGEAVVVAAIDGRPIGMEQSSPDESAESPPVAEPNLSADRPARS